MTSTANCAQVGLVTVSLEGERVELCPAFEASLREGLEAAGFAVVTTPVPAVTYEQVQAAVRHCEAAGAAAVCYAIGTWIDPSTVVPTIQQSGLPALVLANPEPSSFGFTGGSAVHGALDRLGLPHCISLGDPQGSGWDGVLAFANAAAAAKALRQETYGLIGGQSPGQYTGSLELLEVRDVFGLQIEQVEELVIVERARAIDDERARDTLAGLSANYGGLSADQAGAAAQLRAAKLRLALEEFITERGYDFVSVKCIPDTITSYASFCVAAATLNSSCHTVSCQGDIPATIVMEALRQLSGVPAFLGDLVALDPQERLGRLVNCGAAPVALASRPQEVQWMSQYPYMGDGGGVTSSFCARAGRVTVAAMARTAMGLRLMLAGGEAYERPRSALAEVREAWPHAFARFDGEGLRIVEELRSNHVVMGYGDQVQALEALAELWGVETVTI